MNKRRTQQSLGFYFGIILLCAQIIADAVFDAGFFLPAMLITGALILAPLWGPEFVIEFFKVVLLAARGIDSADPKDDDDA